VAFSPSCSVGCPESVKGTARGAETRLGLGRTALDGEDRSETIGREGKGMRAQLSWETLQATWGRNVPTMILFEARSL
jgi:hypothetical protein